MDNKTALLGVLQSYAPNEEAQSLCAHIMREVEAGGATAHEVEKYLIYSLADGFRSGNWPWVIGGMQKK